jgi:hypothetical protein
VALDGEKQLESTSPEEKVVVGGSRSVARQDPTLLRLRSASVPSGLKAYRPTG